MAATIIFLLLSKPSISPSSVGDFWVMVKKSCTKAQTSGSTELRITTDRDLCAHADTMNIPTATGGSSTGTWYPRIQIWVSEWSVFHFITIYATISHVYRSCSYIPLGDQQGIATRSARQARMLIRSAKSTGSTSVGWSPAQCYQK